MAYFKDELHTDIIMSRAAVILPAAGSGSRMQLDHPKQFHMLAGAPVLIHTLHAFVKVQKIKCIVLAISPDYRILVDELLQRYGLGREDIRVVDGGSRRQDSVQAALQAVDDDIDIVLVHDAARPLVTEPLISRCLSAAHQHGAAIAAIPVKDTLKRGDHHNRITETVDRSTLWQAQTPQAIQRKLLLHAYQQNGDADVTDEASLLERAGIPVQLVEGAETNLKITRPEDLVLAEKLLQPQHPAQMRIGHGYDAHRFAADRALILGGVSVDYELGLDGHSDADVLTHALCDAILGALGEGDIGQHFPDSDPKLKGISSIIILRQVLELATNQTYVIGNADITIVCQAPKLAPWLPKMRETLATVCSVEPGQINIKATTTEKMGFTGRQEGIACHAVVILQPRNKRDK